MLSQLAVVADGDHATFPDEPDGAVPYLQAQDFNDFVSPIGGAFVSDAYFGANQRSAIGPNNVLISIMGTVGRVGITQPDFVPCMANRAVGIIRPSPRTLASVIFAYLGSRIAQDIILAYSSGGVQRRINLDLLRQLRVPTFSQKFQDAINHCVAEGFKKWADATRHSKEADRMLTTVLGLASWHPPEPLTYTARSSEAFDARRLDPQYFAPRVGELVSRLGSNGRRVRDAATPRRKRFEPSDSGSFCYMEISDLRTDGTATTNSVLMREAPSRATWYIRKGDVVTSTVRPNRRLSAIVLPEQDGCVASSGFIVLQPQSVPAEVLLTYLRLPIFCELMDLHTSASLYPAISDDDLLGLPFPNIKPATSIAIVSAVRLAHEERDHARALMTRAKHAVEIAMKRTESVALKYIKEG